ncbi:hypothetical protein VB711_10655 [Cronbergia sp. UHCC 0137]|uniref:hypothetical protein n=1 Tax=Cronbergia sp. UHCC 0137 TaxID=3110239 RepID=UPI002B1FDE35|nr:hypothetical protein [Cronbergia sp. UHCC 0137]MEA5618293.1 hypothetical protein [Cronbergia sp. UHCC 0137]
MNYLNDAISQLVWHLPVNAITFAQSVSDPDLLGQMQKSWNHFVLTGQIWALFIGVVIGYMLRTLTSFG